MKKQTRRKFNSSFKAKVALEAIKGQQTLAELAKKFELSQVVISRWKAEFLANAGSVFDKAGKSDEPDVDTHELYAQTLDNSRWRTSFKKKFQETWRVEDRASLISSRVGKLSVRRHCTLLSVGRSRLYYKPRPEKLENLKMMQIMDKHLTDHPTEGVVSLVLFFVARHYPVGPKRIRRLLKLMGRQTIYRRKNLTKQGLKMFIKPYLLNGLSITYANQVWCTDITYIPMKHGFMYLTAIIDVYSRKIVGWGVSNTMTADWCKQVLEEAIARHGKPTIVNSDQGCQYTSVLWTQYLERQGIQVSMDGKGRALDNVWIERFWRSLKYDYVYLNPADDGFELFKGVQSHISYYHDKIHHTTCEIPNHRYEKSLRKAA